MMIAAGSKYRTPKHRPVSSRFSADARRPQLPLLVRLLLGVALALLAALPAYSDEPDSVRARLVAAYEQSSSIDSLEEADQLVSTCQEAMSGDLSAEDRAYASRLLSWGLTKRTDLHQALADYDAELAEQNLTQAIELDATNWRALLLRGVVRGEAERFEEAITDFDAVLKLHPKARHAWFNRAEIRSAMGEYVRAADDYGKAIQLSPRDAQAYAGRGHAFFELERYPQALADYQKVVLLTEGSPMALVHRGDVCARARLWEKARDDYQLAVARDSQSALPLRRLAMLLATCPDQKIQDRSRAVELAEKAMEREPNDPEGIAVLVVAMQAAEREDEALQRRADWQAAHPEVTPDTVQALQERLASESSGAVRR